MSRLIVKNLPLKITEEKVKSTFSSKGVVTDLQLKYTKEGKFRGFAFVGYRTEQEAETARQYFNGTYIGAAKIEVHTCSDLGDHTKNKAWSKHTRVEKPLNENATAIKPASKKLAKAEKAALNSVLDQFKDDPKFQEFLRVHKRSRADAWTNDAFTELVGQYESQNKTEDTTEETEKANKPRNKDKNANNLADKVEKPVVIKKKQNFFHVKLLNLPYKFKKKHVKAFLAPLKPPSVRLPPKIHGIAYVGFLTEKERNQALNKHKSLHEGHQIFVVKYEKKEEEDVEVSSDGSATTKLQWRKQEEALVGVETVGESGRIFVRNLAYSVTEEDLRQLFEKFGPLTEVNLPIDRVTRRSKGFAFVTFMMPEHAVAAFAELDGKTFQGRLLHLIPGKAKDGEGDEELAEGAAGSFKKKKAQKEKAAAGSSHNWNSLFLGGSAVADIMSAKYGVDKADVVLGDSGGKTAAVRLALGETQIVEETKKFLEEEGIHLQAFNKPPDKRSKTIILAKNLPALTHPEEMRDLFSKYGVLGRLVMPPTGVTAVIEFADPGEARSAFTNLAYTRFHSTPLYLEWAPDDTFTSPYSERPHKPAPAAVTPSRTEGVDNPSDAGPQPEPDSTLFVKNLNFKTTEEALKRHFEPAGDIFSVSVASKKDAKTGERLSMGFGFVTFWSRSGADAALKQLQHSRLDTHSLELKRSNRAAERERPGAEAKSKAVPAGVGLPSTKILVRNIPFQATKNEVTEIFKTFGELTAVRLPSKLSGTGSHRGFAFVEFSTKTNAVKAMEQLGDSTHLYGRRLVLEWASQEESLDELRKRTAQQFSAGELSASKRQKFQISEPVSKERE